MKKKLFFRSGSGGNVLNPFKSSLFLRKSPIGFRAVTIDSENPLILIILA